MTQIIHELVAGEVRERSGRWWTVRAGVDAKQLRPGRGPLGSWWDQAAGGEAGEVAATGVGEWCAGVLGGQQGVVGDTQGGGA